MMNTNPMKAVTAIPLKEAGHKRRKTEQIEITAKS
jgi:hypothetical protein